MHKKDRGGAGPLVADICMAFPLVVEFQLLPVVERVARVTVRIAAFRPQRLFVSPVARPSLPRRFGIMVTLAETLQIGRIEPRAAFRDRNNVVDMRRRQAAAGHLAERKRRALGGPKLPPFDGAVEGI